MEEKIKEIEKEIDKLKITDWKKRMISRELKELNNDYARLKKAIKDKDASSILRTSTWLERSMMSLDNSLQIVETGAKPEIQIELEKLRDKIADYYYELLDEVSDRLQEIIR